MGHPARIEVQFRANRRWRLARGTILDDYLGLYGSVGDKFTGGGLMARKASAIGPNVLALIEDAPVDLARSILAVRDSDNEPDFALPIDVPVQEGDDAVEAFRQKLIGLLSGFAPDELRPTEQRARRIRTLSDGKGISSLQTIVEQQFDDEESEAFDQQPDALCRSIWTYLHATETFEDAESFHFARQFRDHGKLYDAFEVELENQADLDASAIDEAALETRIKGILELKPEISCKVKALNLPATGTHPASIMLIVRHGGPLSSVYNYRNDGRRRAIYYRPPNEATLIYTPSLRQIEVCADSPGVRQTVSNAFAEIALGHDVSRKPLTWKRYNLSRFRASLLLPLPEINGYEIKHARVVEVEVRLGTWRRKLQLKVTIEDDIEKVADRYLGAGNILQRAEAFSRIGIAVSYNRAGDETERTLNITIAGTKSCNLQSKTDPEERSLGFALLKEWAILSAFRQLEHDDLAAIFPELVQLHDRVEDEVGGAYLLELGLDVPRLIEGGLLERRDRQDLVYVDEDGLDGEATVRPSITAGMVRTVGPFGEDAAMRPTSDLQMYAINVRWLHETLVRMIKPLLSRQSTHLLDPDLTLLGTMRIHGADVPVYFGRRLNDVKTAQRLDLALRARNTAGIGIILAASENMPQHLGANVVVPLLSQLWAAEDVLLFNRDGIELAYQTGLSLARGGVAPRVVRTDTQAGTLYVPGLSPLPLASNEQLTIFERLVATAQRGGSDVPVKTLMEGFGSRSPQQAFRRADWEKIRDVYIGRGAKSGYWRLLVPGQPTGDAPGARLEAAV